MAFPKVTFEAAPGINAGAVPASDDWEDWTGRLHEFRLRRGRSHELDRMDAGRLTAQVDNSDRRLDPTENDDIFPMLHVRLRVGEGGYVDTYEDEYGGWEAPLFRGHVEALPMRTDPTGNVNRVELDVVDGMVLLKLADVEVDAPEEKTGFRIERLLDEAGWPTSMRDVDVGQSTLQAQTYDTDALSAIREVAATEEGTFYISADGKATFRNRHYRILNQGSVSFEFADDGANNPYVGLVPTYDESQLWNVVRVEAEGKTSQVDRDQASIDKHLKRRKRLSTIHTDEIVMLNHAEWLVWRYAEARLRFDRIDLRPPPDADWWETALSTELGTRGRVRRNLPTGGEINDEVHVERVEVTGRPKLLDVSWRLSPAVRETMWILEDATYGVLGDTTRLGF